MFELNKPIPGASFYIPAPRVKGRKKKNMDLMQIISYIYEKHLETDFNKFRNYRCVSGIEPIETTLILFYQNNKIEIDK